MKARLPHAEFAGVVLAGGRSTRMGRDKAFLRIGGQRLIDRQVALLREVGAAEVFVSGRRGVNYRVGSVPVRLDREPGLGPVGGLLTALEQTGAPSLLVLAVDLAAMNAAVLRELLTRVRAGLGIVPHRNDDWEPLAAVYPREIVALWRPLVAHGERRLQRLIAAGVEAGLLRGWRVPVRWRPSFANWNHPADWRP